MSKLTTKSPVIIISANPADGLFLRNVFAQHPDFHQVTEDTDAIWRHGNDTYPYDTLTIRPHGNRKIQHFVENYFSQQVKTHNKLRFVEYAHANILRPAYLHKMLPHAKIIHLIRDGRYVSAQNMQSELPRFIMPDWSTQKRAYIIEKLKFWQSKHDKNHLTWPEKNRQCQNMSVASIAALEWKKAIETCQFQAQYIPETHYLEMRFEDLQFNTGQTMDTLFKFIDFDRPPFELWSYLKNNIPSRIANWRQDLSAEAQKDIIAESTELLISLEYCDKAA